jgi:hypothetical protein
MLLALRVWAKGELAGKGNAGAHSFANIFHEALRSVAEPIVYKSTGRASQLAEEYRGKI